MKRLLIFLTLFAANAAADIPRFGLFEAAFQSAARYDDPLAQFTGEATLTRPDRSTWSIPLFWDGGQTWRFRVSPDLEGEWSYRITSRDTGIHDKQGTFRCVPSKRHGALQPMKDFPRHFQYQDGTRVWFMGDTNWRLFCSNDEKKLNRDTVKHYIDRRASQGFNYIHADMLGYVAKPSALNEGGSAFLDKGQTQINPAYFQEADQRLRYLNEKGITCGLIYAWGQGDVGWPAFLDDQARLRYARYLTARYSAFNVVLIVSGEWQFMKTRKALFDALGQEVRKSDPHGRMIAIHPGPSIESNGDLAQADWMSFGEYLQAYQVGGGQESTDADRDKLRRYVLGFRKNNKPVVNSEYAYFLRDQNFDGKVDKPHSHTRDSFRRASWMMPMAGAYFVTGFGTTYFGGHRDKGPFDPDSAQNKPAETDLAHLRAFFTAIDWWRLQPTEGIVTATGNKPVACCLANETKTCVIYVSSSTHATLDLSRAASEGPWSVKRYDPREGRFADLDPHRGKTPLTLVPPDNQDWVYLIQSK